MIEGCSFGSIVINGRRYTRDLIIYPDGRIEDGWWRRRGHRLTADDIRALTDSRPEVIVAGTGVFGRMKPDPGLAGRLEELGIAFVALANKKAMARFNAEHRAGRRVGACFHLTC